jgi:hypothetical protein
MDEARSHRRQGGYAPASAPNNQSRTRGEQVCLSLRDDRRRMRGMD